MTADDPDDERLRAVFDQLVTATHLTKQLVWSAPPERRERLKDIATFLVEQSRLVDEAEARIGGRSPAMVAPSGHPRRNLLGEVDSDVDAALTVYVEIMSEMVDEIGAGARVIGDGDAAVLLMDVAEALRWHLGLLGEPQADP